MIRHIVALRFRPDVPPSRKQELYAALDGLRDRIAGMTAFRSFANVSVEQQLVRGFDDLFWCDFADTKARDGYLIDPDHQRIGAEIVAELEGGADGVFVFDVVL